MDRNRELLEKIDSKVDKTSETVGDIKVTVAQIEVHVDQNTKDLEEHIEGVQQNRDRIYRLEKIEQWLRGAAWITIGLCTLAFAVVKLLK